MRFKINLQIHNGKAFLPIDYQYAMASAIYKLIAKGDEAYSNFLHNKGFSPGGLKKFKLFSFSPLVLPRFTIWKDKSIFELHERQVSFVISFMADKAAESFAKGMFVDQQVQIGDYFNTLYMEVTSVEAMPPIMFKETMHYRCASPLTISTMEGAAKYEQYLPPDDPRFEELLFQNLIAKSAALNVLYNDGSSHTQNMKFDLNGSYRSKLVSIKPYTKQETKVRGYLFDFTLTAPDYMHEIGYHAGFGMNNAMGFGAAIMMD